MSAENCIAIYIVKRKRGKKFQRIYIVKYMQGCQPDDFTTEQIEKLLSGSMFTGKFEIAFRMALRIQELLTYTEYGIIVSSKYYNVVVSTEDLKDEMENKIAKLPCFDNVCDFYARIEYWIEKNCNVLVPLDPLNPYHSLILKLRECMKYP
jgi:hypothetical protein